MSKHSASTLALYLLCVCLLATVTAATQRQPSNPKAAPVAASKLTALKVIGTTRYTDKEILAAAGLQIGQNAADGDFKEAVQRLGESGMFRDVSYAYTSSGTGVRLEVTLSDTEAAKLVPASFENFVWFTDDELRTILQHDVPLFKQFVPLTGNLSDRVSEALQSVLSEKKLPGQVTFMREGDESGGALHGIEYRVEGVRITVHALEFPGASPEQLPLLTSAARRVNGSDYSRSALAAVAQFDLLPVYLQRGYLKASFGPSTARVASESSANASDTSTSEAQGRVDAQSAPDVQVVALVPVTPGKVYATSAVDLKGNSAITTSELASLLHLPIGQPADAVRLVRDIEKIGKIYRSRGYMTIQITPASKFDEDKNAVFYDIKVTEGDLYKMGELEILGLDTQATARVRDAWNLHEGQPYNADYPEKFLMDTDQLLPRGVQWHSTVHATPDPKDKTVDVEIRFK
jgi:outer membrane protein assembly factor BamA